MGAVFNKNGPRRVRLKKNHQLKCAHNSDDANKGYNASGDYGGLFASGGDHFGFFPVQNEHDATDAIRVKVFLCVTTDKT